jgi:hypothetical protein
MDGMNEILKSFKKGKKKYQYILDQIKDNPPNISGFGKQKGIDQQLIDAYTAGTKDFRVFYMKPLKQPDGNIKITLSTARFKKIEVAG